MRKFGVLCLAILAPLVAGTSPALSAPGSLDTSFGEDGRVLTDLGHNPGASDVAVTASGRLLVVGNTEDADGLTQRQCGAIPSPRSTRSHLWGQREGQNFLQHGFHRPGSTSSLCRGRH